MEEDLDVLEAEALLAKALKNMEARGRSSRAAAAAQRLRKEPIFSEVARHVGLYDSASANLAPSDFTLSWKRSDAEMYIRSPPGATWFEYRLVASIDASLRHCLAPLHERDLIRSYQPIFVEPHRDLAPPKRHHAIVRTLSRVMSVYIETIFELTRVANRGYGFLVEVARSDFPPAAVTGQTGLPEQPWWSRRIGVDTKNLWMPHGGGTTGTVLVSVARVEVGVSIPDYMLKFIADSLSQTVLANVRRGADLAAERGSPWHGRIEEDADGFYAELAAVEAAAADRPRLSVSSLPGPEVFDRPWHLE